VLEGGEIFFNYHPDINPGMWPDSTDPDGDVAKVDYYLGSVAPEKKLNAADIAAPPFRFLWKGAKAGTHSILAVATDDTGQSATSEAVTITVKP
jgi:chitinase